MRIAGLRLLRGPNVHAATPRAQAQLDLEALAGAPVEPLRRRLAAMDGEASVAGIVGRLAVRLQALAGAPAGGDGDPAPSSAATGNQVVCAYALEAVAEPALEAAVGLVSAAGRGEAVAIDDAVASLRRCVDSHLAAPALRPLLDAARNRGIPVLRLDGAQRFQLGWGSRQRRLDGAVPGDGELDDVGRIPVVSITGTNGKTTTTQLIAHALRLAGRRVGTTTTQGVYLGERLVEEGDCTGYWSARTVLQAPDVDIAVLETARGGILKRGLAFDACDVGVVLNVASDHLGLDGVETLDDLAHVKGLVARCASKAAVLNAEDAYCRRMAQALRPGCEAVYFALDAVQPLLREQRRRGGRLAVVDDGWLVLARGEQQRRLVEAARLPMAMGGHARYNIANALAAAAALERLGLADAEIAAGLSTFASDGRQNPLRSNRFTVGGIDVLVDYAHNLAACAAVFAAARAMLPSPASRLIGVITAPGDRRSDDLAAIGATCGGASDELVVYELNPRGRATGRTAETIVEGARRAAPDRPVRIELDIRQALALGLRQGRPGDVIVFTCAGTLDDLVAGVALHNAAEADRIAAELGR